MDKEIRDALKALVDHYVRMINSGDCGNWDPEEDDVIIAARKALKKEVRHAV